VPPLVAADIDKLKVTELKAEIKKLNQSIRGDKSELKERLLAALANNASLVANQDESMVDNMARHLILTHTGSWLVTRITKNFLMKRP